MVFVGGSVAVSGTLSAGTLYTAQAVRYGIACLLLVGYLRLTGRPLRRPRGSEWLWLLGVAVAGLLIFNVALVRGARHAEPAVLGVAVACVPVLLAAIGPLLEGGRPGRRVLLAAGVVTLGAILVEGTGRTDAAGLAWAVVVFACEAAFTLLAVPLLKTQGPNGISVHTTWIATVLFGVVGLASEGPTAVLRLDAADWAAIGYLAVAVTAVAFVLWYSCVRHLGPGRAGLLTGVAPVAAAAVGVPVSGALPSVPVWLGIGLIAAGLARGLG
jgi:drug/metabolite transporter (DMT)-like permease